MKKTYEKSLENLRQIMAAIKAERKSNTLRKNSYTHIRYELQDKYLELATQYVELYKRSIIENTPEDKR